MRARSRSLPHWGLPRTGGGGVGGGAWGFAFKGMQAVGLMMVGIFAGGLLHFVLDYQETGSVATKATPLSPLPSNATIEPLRRSLFAGGGSSNVSRGDETLTPRHLKPPRKNSTLPKPSPATQAAANAHHVMVQPENEVKKFIAEAKSKSNDSRKEHRTRRKRSRWGVTVWGVKREEIPLTIFEPYESRLGWDGLRPVENELYRGVSLRSGHRRQGSDDVDAPGLFFTLEDEYYRNMFCEHGAILAVGKHLEYVHRRPWVGFQYPPRVAFAGGVAPPATVGLSVLAERRLIEAIRANRHGGMAFYYWSLQPSKPNSAHFYEDCNADHSKKCTVMFAEAFQELFRQTRKQMPEPPPMPSTGGVPWAYPNGWAMHHTSFNRFVSFSRLFITALDNVFFSQVHNQGLCVLAEAKDPFYQEEVTKHCFCYLLERLVSIWAYHSGVRMIYVHPVSGTMTEAHPVEHRQMWAQWFGGLPQRILEREFGMRQLVTPPNPRDLLRRLGLQDVFGPL